MLFCALGCTEYDTGLSETGGLPLELGGEVVQQYVTRANDGGFADADQIGVFIVNYADGKPQALQPEGNHADNVRFTFDAMAGSWTGDCQLYWKDEETCVDAYGYYPYDARLSDVSTYSFSLRRNQQDEADGESVTGYELSDFLWAKSEYNAPGTRILLKYQHLMAGVEVTLVAGENMTEEELVGYEKSVVVQNTLLGTTIDLSTGTVTAIGDEPTGIIPQTRGTTWRAVVAPQTVAAGKSLLGIAVNGSGYRFIRNEDMTFLSGKLHKFTIAVNNRMDGDFTFTLVSEAITAWENDSESHNGSAREYVTVHIEEGQYLGNVIDSLGLDPANIINLKLTGIIGDYIGGWHEWGEPWYANGGDSFNYIRNNMTSLEAINMKELRTKNMNSFWWEGGWGEPPYNQPIDADDYIPRGAFENMYQLRYVVWPDSLKGIGDGAFPGTNLTGSLILPEGLKHIGTNAFGAYGHRPSTLTGELYIPSTVEYIGYGAFGGWDGNCDFYFTNELILPEKMLYLGENAFGGCQFMTGTIRIPDGLTEVNPAWPSQIGGVAVVPQGVTKVNRLGCPVAAVYFPEGVTEIGRIHDGTSQPWQPYESSRKILTKVHLPSTLKTLGDNAFAGSGIRHIDLPEGLEVIPPLAFRLCDLQDTLKLPSTVTKIEEQAFHQCKMLSAVILPKDLGIIEEHAFADCFSLDYIQCLGTEPPVISDNTFSGVEKDNFTVVVPVGAVETYRNADGWKEFKRISAYRNFVCRPMQAKLLNKGHTRDIVLNADDSWKVTHCPDWITLDKTSGYKKTELQATIATMAHGQGDRSDSIVFQLDKNDEYGDPITCYYKVQQFDYDHEEDGVQRLQTATKGSTGGIDLLFLGDGYDAEDIADGTFLSHMEEEMEYFFGIEPYKTYKDYFNVNVAFSMSLESGMQDSPDKWRNTKFGIYYSENKTDRLVVDFDGISSYAMGEVTNSPVTAGNSWKSMVICVLNSEVYEGKACMYGNGFAVAVCPMSRYDYPNDARGIIQHEAGGHGFGKLGDEYIYHRAWIQTCNCVCCDHVEGVEGMHAMGWGLNLSLEGKYKSVPWSHLIFDSRYDDIVDIYEGGYMHARGIYRSELNSCMNNNVPYYSTWSRQLIVERIMQCAGETFDFETFVANDSREMGDKFLTRGVTEPRGEVQAIHTDHHGPVIRKGSPADYIKKGGNKQ